MDVIGNFFAEEGESKVDKGGSSGEEGTAVYAANIQGTKFITCLHELLTNILAIVHRRISEH